jgi:hypothetical protein
VISVLGSWGTKRKDVLSSAMKTIIPAMDQQKIKRIVTLTGSGAVQPGQAPNFIERTALSLAGPFPAGKVFRDGIAHMDLLAKSDLDWTVLRSPVMTSHGNTVYHLSMKPQGVLETVSRHSVATSLVDQLATKKYIHQSPYIHRR